MAQVDFSFQRHQYGVCNPGFMLVGFDPASCTSCRLLRLTLFAKKSQYLLEYTFSVLGKKTPVGMLNPVLHVELALEFFNELPSVFALEPAK